jgi:hypothetical protein
VRSTPPGVQVEEGAVWVEAGAWSFVCRLRGFLFERGFKMGKVDHTLFLLRQGRDILIVHVYVDDIVFGGSSNSLVARFEDMSREFEMSMMGEL